MRTLLLLVFLTSKSVSAQQTCFVRVDSTVRRDVVRVCPAASQVDCNIRCVETPGCEACMFYEDKANCIMMGVARSPPPGSCPRSYACYEKRYTGCPVRSPPAVDRGYSPGVCSEVADILGPPVPGGTSGTVCGPAPSIGQRRIVLDAIRNDGKRLVLENIISSYVQWDSEMGSWYYYISGYPLRYLNGNRIYFKSAACVRAPSTALVPACECAPLPSEPVHSGETLSGATVRTDGTNPVCGPQPSSIQATYRRIRTTSGADQAWNNTRVIAKGACIMWRVAIVSSLLKMNSNRILQCVMGEWMLVTAFGGLNEHTILSAICVV